MKRYLITLGATTTAGGVVISAGSLHLIEGVPVALEGDTVQCPACKCCGQIRCSGARLVQTSGGGAVALDNDICACHCPVLPRLVAKQFLQSQG